MDNLEQITALATLAGLATTITGFYFGKFMERRSNHNERMELIHSQLNGETDVGNLDIYQHDPKSDRYSHQGKTLLKGWMQMQYTLKEFTQTQQV